MEDSIKKANIKINGDEVTLKYGVALLANDSNYELNQYFYHKDQLGSSSYITDIYGEAYQHAEYLPFGETFVEERNTAQDLNPYLYNGKELDAMTGLYYYGARYYDPFASVFLGVDPLTEKKSGLSPYHFCSNNPINRLDPDGRDDFTINKKTGDVKLIKGNDDPDRILKTNGKGEVMYKKNGEARVAVGGIEQGILKDRQNFKNKAQVINVGGKGQPTVKGVEDFSLKLSEYVGTEIARAYFTKKGSKATTHITIGNYKNNTLQSAKGHGHSEGIRQGLKLNEITGFYHTHPSTGISVSDRTRASEADINARDDALKHMSHMKFFIITAPLSYGADNEKIDYTNH